MWDLRQSTIDTLEDAGVRYEDIEYHGDDDDVVVTEESVPVTQYGLSSIKGLKLKNRKSTLKFVRRRDIQDETKSLCNAFIDLFPSITDKIFEASNPEFNLLYFGKRKSDSWGKYRCHELDICFMASQMEESNSFLADMILKLDEYIVYIDVLLEVISESSDTGFSDGIEDLPTSLDYYTRLIESNSVVTSSQIGMGKLEHIRSYSATNDDMMRKSEDREFAKLYNEKITRRINVLKKHRFPAILTIVEFKKQLERYRFFVDSFQTQWQKRGVVTFDASYMQGSPLPGEIKDAMIDSFPTISQNDDQMPTRDYVSGMIYIQTNIAAVTTFSKPYGLLSYHELKKTESTTYYDKEMENIGAGLFRVKSIIRNPYSFFISRCFSLPLDMYEIIHIVVHRGNIYHHYGNRFFWDRQTPRFDALTCMDYVFAIIKSMFGANNEFFEYVQNAVVEI